MGRGPGHITGDEGRGAPGGSTPRAGQGEKWACAGCCRDAGRVQVPARSRSHRCWWPATAGRCGHPHEGKHAPPWTQPSLLDVSCRMGLCSLGSLPRSAHNSPTHTCPNLETACVLQQMPGWMGCLGRKASAMSRRTQVPEPRLAGWLAASLRDRTGVRDRAVGPAGGQGWARGACAQVAHRALEAGL